MSNNAPVKLRLATQDDVPFIFSSWLKSYRNSNTTRHIPNEIYYTNHHVVIEKIIAENKVLVACSESDDDQIFGYVVTGDYEGFFMIHYVYVKHSFRSMGIGRALLNATGHDASKASLTTHWTRAIEKLAPDLGVVFHPYLLPNIKES